MLSSCFPTNKRSVIDDQTYDGDDPLMFFPNEIIKKMYDEMRTEYENNLIYLHIFKEINKRFCNLLKDQRNDCDITKRISNSGGFEVQCQEEDGLKQTKFNIKMAGKAIQIL